MLRIELFAILVVLIAFVDGTDYRPAEDTIRFAAIVSSWEATKYCEKCAFYDLIFLIRFIGTATVVHSIRIRMIRISITNGQAEKVHCRPKAHSNCTRWVKLCVKGIIDCCRRMEPTQPAESTSCAVQLNGHKWVLKVCSPGLCLRWVIEICCLFCGNRFRFIRFPKEWTM